MTQVVSIFRSRGLTGFCSHHLLVTDVIKEEVGDQCILQELKLVEYCFVEDFSLQSPTHILKTLKEISSFGHVVERTFRFPEDDKERIKELKKIFSFDKGVYIVTDDRYPEQEDDKQKAIERIRGRVKEKVYRAKFNNCEHLVTWALTKEAYSVQIESSVVKSFVATMFDTVIDMINNGKPYGGKDSNKFERIIGFLIMLKKISQMLYIPEEIKEMKGLIIDQRNFRGFLDTLLRSSTFSFVLDITSYYACPNIRIGLAILMMLIDAYALYRKLKLANASTRRIRIEIGMLLVFKIAYAFPGADQFRKYETPAKVVVSLGIGMLFGE